jgi:hypothetical protein
MLEEYHLLVCNLLVYQLLLRSLARLILSILKIEATRSSETSVLTRPPHGATSMKAAFFLVAVVKTYSCFVLVSLTIFSVAKNIAYYYRLTNGSKT